MTSGEFAFRRIELALSGYYLLGVEPAPTDRDGKRHRIEVKTARRGVTRAVASRLPVARRPARRHAHRGAHPHAQVAGAGHRGCRCGCRRGPTRSPARRACGCWWRPKSSAAATESLSYAAGLVVATKEGKVIAANAEPRELPPLEGDERLAVYAGSVTLDPGEYRLRLAAGQRRQEGGQRRTRDHGLADERRHARAGRPAAGARARRRGQGARRRAWSRASTTARWWPWPRPTRHGVARPPRLRRGWKS